MEDLLNGIVVIITKLDEIIKLLQDISKSNESIENDVSAITWSVEHEGVRTK